MINYNLNRSKIKNAITEKSKSYYNLLFPEKLKEGEYIKIIGFHKDNGQPCQDFVKDFNEFEYSINLKRKCYNVFVCLSTCTDKGSKLEDLISRHVLFLDIDKKDNPDIKPSDIYKAFKERMPNIFIHCLIDSGHGYHVYIGIEKCNDMNKVTAITKEIANALKGRIVFDEKAMLGTQLARIPKTINFKDYKAEGEVWCNIVSNNIENEKFRRFTCNEILKLISSKNVTVKKSFPCIENMIQNGAVKGERNFCIGRIYSFYKNCGLTDKDILAKVYEFNSKCQPPKSERELISEFNGFKNRNYRYMTLCKFSNERYNKILSKYCSPECKAKDDKKDTTAYFELNSYFAQSVFVRKHSPMDILILIIISSAKCITRKQLVSMFAIENSFSERTILKHLSALVDAKLVEKVGRNYYIRKSKHLSSKVLKINVEYVNMLISKKLSITTLPVYIALYTLVKSLHSCCDYNELSYYTGIDKANISRYIAQLYNASIITVEKKPIANCNYTNYYTI